MDTAILISVTKMLMVMVKIQDQNCQSVASQTRVSVRYPMCPPLPPYLLNNPSKNLSRQSMSPPLYLMNIYRTIYLQAITEVLKQGTAAVATKANKLEGCAGTLNNMYISLCHSETEKDVGRATRPWNSRSFVWRARTKKRNGWLATKWSISLPPVWLIFDPTKRKTKLQSRPLQSKLFGRHHSHGEVCQRSPWSWLQFQTFLSDQGSSGSTLVEFPTQIWTLEAKDELSYTGNNFGFRELWS